MISQREARRLKKRVERLESILDGERRRWGAEYVGGVNIATAGYAKGSEVNVAISTARLLRHAVVAVADDTSIRFYALPFPEVAE